MSNSLSVVAAGQLMGRVYEDGPRFVLRYDPGWRDSPSAFPLSLSMPLVVGEHEHRPVEAFLWGLLPDNSALLEKWGRRFQVSPRNPFRLLANVGEDCAGAVQFVRDERLDAVFATSDAPTVKWMDDKELAGRIERVIADASATRYGSDTGQFSLAGAQPKVAFYRDPQTERWGVPEGRTPTTHILKPATGAFDGQVENEHFCLQLAAELGFPAAGSWIMDCGGRQVIVSERYDRHLAEGRIARVHQEDFCQALAIRPQIKYQNQGGPSAKAIAALLWDQSSSAADDVARFAEALVFNWLIAGTDAHGKNFSLLLAPDAEVRLVPLYDVSSSLPYPMEIQPRKAAMAMRIGSDYRIRQIRRGNWEACAREIRLPAPELLGRIHDMIRRLPAAAETVGRRMDAGGITHPVVERLVSGIGGHCRECLDQLD